MVTRARSALLVSVVLIGCGASSSSASSPSTTSAGGPAALTAADAERLVATVRPKLEACHKTSGGKLHIHVSENRGKLVFDVRADASLDPTEKECVLGALAEIHPETASNLTSGAAVPPTGFTSLVTIDW